MSITKSFNGGTSTIPESHDTGWAAYTTDALADLFDGALADSDIVDGLASTDATKVLSAKQGKALSDLDALKVPISAIVNDLTTGGTAVPLSAEQGKTLQANKVTKSTVAPADGDVAGFDGTTGALIKSLGTLAALKNAIDPLGIPKAWMQTNPPDNHILGMNKTIGDNTGDYQGADYLDLYTALWANAGTANTTGHWMTNGAAKGVNAATDWAAHRTITVDYRGAVLRAIGAGVGWTETTETNATVNAKQDDQAQNHKHNITPYKNAAGAYSLNHIIDRGGADAGVAEFINSAPVAEGANGTPRVGKETRMKNIGVNIIFRYK
jgi:hypothetical protein